MYSDYNILAYGRGILISWKQSPSKDLLTCLIQVRRRLVEDFKKEVVLTYQELLIKNIDPTKANMQAVSTCLNTLDMIVNVPSHTRLVRIPVCYDPSFGVDLEAMARAKSIPLETVIELHTTPEYLVYFLGFLPGFPYLLGLDKRLLTPRKAAPSRKVVAGSVAIAGEQTGIYPQDSPGGWHVIGHCPIPIFDVQSEGKTVLKSGDSLKFEAVTLNEHTQLSKLSMAEFLNSSFVQK